MFHDTIAHVAMAMGWNAKHEVWIPTVRVEQKSTVTAAIDKSAALWRRVKGPHVAVAAQKQGEIMQAPAMVGTAGDGESWFF